MTDTLLAEAIIRLQVPHFGPSQKNKGDSRSCLFRPRRLLSSPEMLDHIGQRLCDVVQERCSSRAIMGLATSGIAWAAVAAAKAHLPMLYVRKTPEPGESNDLIEGIFPADRRVVLIDDLLFTGESKRRAAQLIRQHGLILTEIVVIIDRQLQKCIDGPSLQDRFGLKLHSLINMSEIVDYMIRHDSITYEQLEGLRADYRRFKRWDPPDFMNADQPT